VLDAYHGTGTIWQNVQKQYAGKIKTLKIDKLQKDPCFVMIGDNEKFMESIDLTRFDVIDLDAYGVPFEQLEIMFRKGWKGLCFVTFIQSVMGILPHEMLKLLNYPEAAIKDCPTLLGKNGFKKFCNYLFLRGVKKVTVRQNQRKAYLAFQT